MLLTKSITLCVWVSNYINTHKSIFSFICISFAQDFFLSTGFHPCTPNLASKNRLKSPPNIMLIDFF